MRAGSPAVSSGCDRDALSKNRQVLCAEGQSRWLQSLRLNIPECPQRAVCVSCHLQSQSIALPLYASCREEDAQGEFELGHISRKLKLAAFAQWSCDRGMQQESMYDKTNDSQDPIVTEVSKSEIRRLSSSYHSFMKSPKDILLSSSTLMKPSLSARSLM
jgi:hypothetical protein